MGNFTTYFILWGVLALAVAILAIYRKTISTKEDDTLHLNPGDAAVTQQTALAGQLAVIDRWGKILTVIAIVSGLVLGGLYMYKVWVDQSRIIAQ